MSHALLIFHALAGCDTVSGFVRDGKNQNCMSVQNLLLVLTDALLTLRSQNKACRPLRGCTHVYMSTCMHWCEQDWEEALCPEQRIPLPYIHCSEIARQEEAGHVWGHLSDSLYFLLQVDGGGSRLMVNHIGPHFQKHPRPAMNWSLITARVL